MLITSTSTAIFFRGPAGLYEFDIASSYLRVYGPFSVTVMYMGTPYELTSSDVLRVLSAVSLELSTYGPSSGGTVSYPGQKKALQSLSDYLGGYLC